MRLFDVAQLRRFLAGEYPDLAGQLIEGAVPLSTFVEHAIGELERAGHVAKPLFQALRTAFPRQDAPITDVEHAWQEEYPRLGATESGKRVATAERLLASSRAEDWDQAALLALGVIPPRGQADTLGPRISGILHTVRGRMLKSSVLLLSVSAVLRELRKIASNRWVIGGTVTTGIGVASFYLSTDEAGQEAVPALPPEDRAGAEVFQETDLPPEPIPKLKPSGEEPRHPSQPTAMVVRKSSERGHSSRSGNRGEGEECLRQKIWDVYPEGWAIRTIASTDLAQGEHQVYKLTLYAGNEYRILACAGRNAINADLVLYDADGVLLVQDATATRQPILVYAPTSTDTYYLSLQAARMADATAVGDFSVGVTYR